MTASNLIVQPLATWLITDTAAYDDYGTVVALGSKVALVPGLPIAMALSGSAATRELQDRLNALAPTSTVAVLDALPAILRELLRADRIAYPADGDLGYSLQVALWCRDRRCPRGYVVATDQRSFGPTYEPFKVVEVNHSTSGGFTSERADEAPVTPEQALGRPVSLCDPSSFNPRADGLTLIEAQRRRPWRAGGRLAHRVGGQAELTRVSRRGVEQTVLRVWPDRVGKKIAA